MHEKVWNGSTIWQALDSDMIAEAHIDNPWHRVNWRRARAAVRRLQTRIVKAMKAGHWRLVRKLQNLLTRSTAAKLLAVRRVTSNRGRKTPGVDGVVFDTPEAKWQAMERLNSAGYRPSPLRRVYLPKPNGKKRPLGIPTMQDRAMQALYSLALDPVVETKSDPHSYVVSGPSAQPRMRGSNASTPWPRKTRHRGSWKQILKGVSITSTMTGSSNTPPWTNAS